MVAFPKHAENGHHSKVLRCGYKPPEATALTGKELLSSCDSLHSTTEQAAFPHTPWTRQSAQNKPQYKGPMWLFTWLHDAEGDACGCVGQIRAIDILESS